MSYNSRERTGLLVLAGVIVVVIAALFIARGCSGGSDGDRRGNGPEGRISDPTAAGGNDSDVIVVDSLAGKRDSIENAKKEGRKIKKEEGKYKKKGRKRGRRSKRGTSSERTVPYRDILGDTIPVADS